MAPAGRGRYSTNTMSERAASAAGTLRTGRSYSSLIWMGMGFGALALAFLPIPVATRGLLPAYPSQARFLAFYAPVACFLTLAYLFYVRDTGARLTFHGPTRILATKWMRVTWSTNVDAGNLEHELRMPVKQAKLHVGRDSPDAAR